ncbi:uncharacterized protein LOC131313882 [Rhododendron vialii]|uniref:uncharacterized protein LOC131313882 n=1 Tax=Rhododendron vialii TaxID=182163 RepID=UPI00265EE295|nr:uncharacterized protein LOC131313882 [Rhododendron vialii]
MSIKLASRDQNPGSATGFTCINSLGQFVEHFTEKQIPEILIFPPNQLKFFERSNKRETTNEERETPGDPISVESHHRRLTLHVSERKSPGPATTTPPASLPTTKIDPRRMDTTCISTTTYGLIARAPNLSSIGLMSRMVKN